MHRLYSFSKDISGDKITIDDKGQVHHGRDVIRLKIGEDVVIFDENANEYRSILEEIFPEKMVFKVKEKRKFMPKPSEVKVSVACAIPKDSRLEEIIDKLTQLGIDRIIPLETERVVVKLNREKRISRLERWKKIALNASKQSQRNTLPELEPIKNMKEFLSGSKDFGLKLIPTLIGERKPLKEILEKSKAKNVLVAIGPEGDFTQEEVNLAKRAGFIPVSLGDLVLRVETAAVAAASFIGLYYEKR